MLFRTAVKLHRGLSTPQRCFSLTSLALQSDLPESTASRYPHVKRRDFSEITEIDVQHFRNILSDSAVLTNADELQTYNTDWLKNYRGQSQLVLKPSSTKEVSEILRYCNGRNLAVCPQGGNTGLVGGGVPVFDEVILSTARMNKIIKLDEVSGILTCQAGCVLEQLDDYVGSHGLVMPLDLGAKGSCHIGGNVATNAGGIRLLRYGSLHGSVLGIEAVLANGEVVDCLSALRKDNTGYDVKQLFIGSEGTLGVVTAVSILCPQRPSAVSVAFVGCKDFETILEIYKAARKGLGEILSAFEFIDTPAMDCTMHNLPSISIPIGKCPFYVLIETSGSNSAHDEEKLERFLEETMSSGLVMDGTVTADPSKVQAIWYIREMIGDGLQLEGYAYKYDLSLPMDRYYKVVEVMEERVGHVATTVSGHGHIGDGNIHFNVTSREYSRELKELLEPYVFDYVAECGGSVSAEHGLGFSKPAYIYHSKSRAAVSLMKQIKHLFDPRGILNPYKTLPSH